MFNVHIHIHIASWLILSLSSIFRSRYAGHEGAQKFNVILIALPLLVTGCGSSDSFESFYDSYFNDPDFAIAHTRFPVKDYIHYAGYIPPSEADHELKEILIEEFKQWPLVSIKNYINSSPERHITNVAAHSPCSYKECMLVQIGLPNSDLASSFIFVKQSGSWSLLEIHSSDM